MSIFRRSRSRIVISITSDVVECVVVSSYRSRIVVESHYCNHCFRDIFKTSRELIQFKRGNVFSCQRRLRQRRRIMFCCCVSVCVCGHFLLARYLQKLRTDFVEIFWRDRMWPREESFRFCWRSGCFCGSWIILGCLTISR